MRTRALELTRLVEERTVELRKSQRELEALANYDALISLPNRRKFSEDFATMSAHDEREMLLLPSPRFR